MGKKNLSDLSAAEKSEIVQCLGQDMKTLDISRKLKCDHRTIKRFVADSEHTRVRADKGKMRKVSARQIRRIKRAAAKMPLQSCKQTLVGVPPTLRLAVVRKPSIRPALNNIHRQKQLQ